MRNHPVGIGIEPMQTPRHGALSMPGNPSFLGRQILGNSAYLLVPAEDAAFPELLPAEDAALFFALLPAAAFCRPV